MRRLSQIESSARCAEMWLSEHYFWWGKNTVKLSVVPDPISGLKLVQRDHHVCGVGYGTRKRCYQLAAASGLVVVVLILRKQPSHLLGLRPWLFPLVLALLVVIILVPSLPTLLNCFEIHRRRSWHSKTFTYKHAQPIAEADAMRYNQVHFNGTLQRRGINFDCLSSQARYELRASADNDPASPGALVIVDGVSTAGSEFLHRLETGLFEALRIVTLQPHATLHLSGFSRGAFAAMIVASVVHKLTGTRPFMLICDPVIGYTAAMPRRGLHGCLLRVMELLSPLLNDELIPENGKRWAEPLLGSTSQTLTEVQKRLELLIDDALKAVTDELTADMVHPQSCAYFACGEVRRMMDPYLPPGLTPLGVLFSGFHTTALGAYWGNQCPPSSAGLLRNAVPRPLSRPPTIIPRAQILPRRTHSCTTSDSPLLDEFCATSQSCATPSRWTGSSPNPTQCTQHCDRTSRIGEGLSRVLVRNGGQTHKMLGTFPLAGGERTDHLARHSHPIGRPITKCQSFSSSTFSQA